MSLKIANLINKPYQQGSMLISVLFMILIMAVLMAGMVTLSSQSSQQLVYEVQSLKTRLVAESILERQAFVLLNDINAAQVPNESIGSCEGYIARLDSNGTITPRQVNITATGKCATARLTVIRNIEVEVIDEN